jgi:uncharacterized protein YndB with AHSA1/START domain
MAFRGCFHEVRPPELIVQTFTFEGAPDDVPLERIRFEPLAHARTRLSATMLVESFAARDALISTGMDEGIRDGFTRLDTLLPHL